MNRTIQLNNQVRRMTIEIHDESCNDLLPAEVETVHPAIPEQVPKHPLRRRHTASQ
jgi:hypothetical protein